MIAGIAMVILGGIFVGMGISMVVIDWERRQATN